MKKVKITLLVLVVLIGGLFLWPETPAQATGAWMRTAGVEPRFESVDGLKIRYVRRGSGPPVVLIHGFGSSVYTWQDVIPELARAHDVVALDLPGFGGSDQPPDLSADRFPRIIVGLMARLGIQRASLVGNSMGGGASLATAARFPDRVERIVLVDSAGPSTAAAGRRPWILRVTGSRVAGGIADRLPVRRLLVRAALRQVFDDKSLVTPDRVEEYLAPLMRPGALESSRSVMRNIQAGSLSFEDLAKQIKAPVLILWGREDAWIPVANADRFEASLPGSKKIILEHCGHVPQEEKPGEVVKAIEEFLARPTT